ncbi:hypothetical protein T492DRAFT_878207 [Pavlovales sp. CCMP2436]|nr:hypothetical protein T492DRAFT_878207 [Pavlovales sp. CCMP2436]
MHATPSASAHSDALATSSPLHYMHATPSASTRSDALTASGTHFAVTGSLCRHRHALAAARSDVAAPEPFALSLLLQAPAIQPQILSKVQPHIRFKMQLHILFKDQSSRSWRHR